MILSELLKEKQAEYWNGERLAGTLVLFYILHYFDSGLPTLPSQIPIYNSEQQDKLRAASRFNAQLLDFVRDHVQPGVTTEKLDQLAHEYTLDHGHIPACLGYKGFPKTICTSINEVVCHGIPDATVLKSGDIINVDLTTIVDGWFGDQSETFLIGDVSDEARQLVQTTFESLYAGIDAVKPGGSVYEIGQAIKKFVQPKGYGIVREYQGHGIGHQFHQEPGVPHYPVKSSLDDILLPGTCLTIEPMLNLGTWKTGLDQEDGWTVRTTDGALSAQFEHTVLITESGLEILTKTENGPKPGHVF